MANYWQSIELKLHKLCHLPHELTVFMICLKDQRKTENKIWCPRLVGLGNFPDQLFSLVCFSWTFQMHPLIGESKLVLCDGVLRSSRGIVSVRRCVFNDTLLISHHWAVVYSCEFNVMFLLVKTFLSTACTNILSSRYVYLLSPPTHPLDFF